MKKCDAKCDTRHGADLKFNGYHLWLRNNIFYYRIELARKDNKRRYKRISLHTSNFYEAREMIKTMNTNLKDVLAQIRTLYNNLDIETYFDFSGASDAFYTCDPSEFEKRRLSQNNQLSDVEDLLSLSDKAKRYTSASLSSEDRELLKEVAAMRPLLVEFIKIAKNSVVQQKSASVNVAPARKISEVLEIMLTKGNNCQPEQVRKRNTIVKLLSVVKLNLDDDYSSFHCTETINKIAKHITGQINVKGDLKRRQLRYIKELATCGSNIDSDNYKANVILNLPKVEKTRKSEKNPHQPYSKEQLLEIFNPKHSHFKTHPDAFWSCLIAMFTGTRANGSITLQYDDVFEKDGINCIYFRENHQIKHLKNESSERIVPVHHQLLELGFVDYVRNRQKELNAKGTDFIFPKCQTKSGEYNNKYTERYIMKFFREIGVKSSSNDGFDFHSFRKNISNALQSAGIINTYINDIIGWEGQNTMEQSYSNHTLMEIKTELDKFNYDFLSDYFVEWKKIMESRQN